MSSKKCGPILQSGTRCQLVLHWRTDVDPIGVLLACLGRQAFLANMFLELKLQPYAERAGGRLRAVASGGEGLVRMDESPSHGGPRP